MRKVILIAVILGLFMVGVQTNTEPSVETKTISFGFCRISVDPNCPDPEINYFLFTQNHPESPEIIRIGADPTVSNLTSTSFNPSKPTKIIVHGYNSNMDLPALVAIRKEYLKTNDFNVFTVDWSPLAQGPCYPGAVWNIPHVGNCIALLIERIREFGATDIHVIGFSLGAHVINYIAIALRPYVLPRVTGLDPAFPGFLTPDRDKKLDKTDGKFVDVIHTNAFMQGKVEESGHVDFYVNGGVFQPGCWAENRFFACNHHRAPIYFAESINTEKGFYGWPCPSYGQYLLGRCPPVDPQIIMGEHADRTVHGVHLVITESVAPYAVGKYTGPDIEIIYKQSENSRAQIWRRYRHLVMDMIDEDDVLQILEDQTPIIGDLNRDFLDDVFV